MRKIDRVILKPYDPQWPQIFQEAAALVKSALGDNCVALHHVGSTSVPGLAAKPKIDIIGVVQDLLFDPFPLEALGYPYRGGFNIPLRKSFTLRRRDININLHIFEKDDPEIELNLLFRDYLREHPTSRDEYARLKYKLVAEESSHEKKDSIYRGYTLGKNDFIQNILKNLGFCRHRFVLCTHYSEWAAARHFRNTYFGPGIEELQTFDQEKHSHLVLYHGTEIVAYAHIQFWPDQRAAIRIITAEEKGDDQNSSSRFLALIEKWLRTLDLKSIHAESRQSSIRFYVKNGYCSMRVDAPEGHKSVSNEVLLTKIL